jgi:hypothetical protein
MKRILFLNLSVLCFLFLFSSTHVSASDLDTLDNELLKVGVEYDVIQTLNTFQKENLLETAKDRDYSGSKFVTYNTSSNTYNTYDTNQVSLMSGYIPADELVLTLSYFNKKDSSNNLDSIRLTLYYNWDNLPLMRFSDPITISWNSNNFRAVDNSFYFVNKYEYDYLDGFYEIKRAIKTRDEGYMPASSSSSGVTWYADIAGILQADTIYGFGYIDVEPLETVNTVKGSDQFHFNYAHSLSPLSISANIGEYGSVNYSGGTYDKLGDYTTDYWDYTQYVSSPYISMASNGTSYIKVAVKNTYNTRAEMFVKISGRISAYESIGYVNAGETVYKTFYGLSSGTNYTVYAYADRHDRHTSNISTKAVYTKSSGGVTPTPYVINPEIY